MNKYGENNQKKKSLLSICTTLFKKQHAFRYRFQLFEHEKGQFIEKSKL